MEFVMNIILSSVRMATPLIFLALAELFSQRAGLVHIGLEGLASIGSLVGFLVSLITGSPMLGVLAGAAVGILVNMIFAYATVTLCAEQIVYGMAINIFAPALAAFIYRVYFGAGSELVQVGLMNTLSSSLGITSDNFLVRLLLDQTPMVYLAYGLVIFTVIYFNRTKSGLNYKAVGEYPKAADRTPPRQTGRNGARSTEVWKACRPANRNRPRSGTGAVRRTCPECLSAIRPGKWFPASRNPAECPAPGRKRPRSPGASAAPA